MAPKRKRKTLYGGYPRKKKGQQQEQEQEQEQEHQQEQEQEQEHQQEQEQEHEEERQEQHQAEEHQEQQQKEQEQEQEHQEEVVMKRSSSCSSSDHDDVCLISPPPTKNINSKTTVINVSSSNKKKARKGRQISIQKARNIDFLKETLQPVPLSNIHLTDLSEHEEVFQKLGLWEFANLEFDLEPSVGDLAQLVMTYDSVARVSIVRDTKVKVSRADLARALRIPYKKEKNSNFLEMPDFKGTPGYPIESCGEEGVRAVLCFVSSRVYPRDDPSLISEEMVGLVENALKSEQNVDWASLIWSRAEKELLQGKLLEKFYYALHFQQLIKFQRPNLLTKDSTELGHEEEEDFVLKTRILQDLDVANAENVGELPEDGGTIDEDQGEQGLQQKVENAENDGKNVDDAVVQQGAEDVLDPEGAEDVLDQERAEDVLDPEGAEDVLDQQRVEENEADQSTRDGEDKHSGGGLVESILRPCSIDITEKRECDEDNKDSRRLQNNSEKLDGLTEVSSHGEHLSRPPPVENALSELEKGRESNLDACLEKPTSPEQLLSKFDNGIFTTTVAHLEKSIPAELQFLEGDKGLLLNSTIHLEKSIPEEPQFIEGDQGMMLNSTAHLENTASAEQMMFEMEKGMDMNPSVHLQRPTSAEHLVMSEIEKDMTLSSALHMQRDSSAENLIMLMNQGPSHSGNVRKMEIDEDNENVRKMEIDADNEFRRDPEKKPRRDVPLSFDTCMMNVYEYLQSAETCYVNEKEALTHRANAEIQELYQQLNQRDYAIQRLQMGKQEEQQRAMECSKLKTNLLLTNKTFYGYTKALEEAQDTINHLRETIRQQDSTIVDLHQQLQQKQKLMEEAELYFKEHISHLNQYMQDKNEKLMSDLDKGMHKQASLEEKLDMLKVEIEKQQSEPLANDLPGPL